MAAIDPYKTLQITDPKTYTYDQVRSNFKRLVLEYHPDRTAIQNVGELNKSPVFQTLKFSYDYLVAELKNRDSDKPHHELKAAAKAVPIAPAPSATNIAIKPEKFDITKFNSVFNENRLKDAYDEGYGNWTEDTPQSIQKAIITYKDPEPYATGRFSSSYELGRDRVGDYSGDTVGTSLKFMDFKLAHTTTMLVDPNTVNDRPEFKTVDEIKKHRATMPLEATEADLLKRHAAKVEAEKLETARIQALKDKDSLVDKIYNKTHQLLLSAFGS